VLRSSPGLEVIEIGCPAQHDTLVEDDIGLPTSRVDPDRDFGGQRFVRHIAANWRAETSASTRDDFVHRDTGIAAATAGLADAQVLTRPTVEAASAPMLTHHGEFALVVVLRGSAQVAVEFQSEVRVADVVSRDAIAIPAGSNWAWTDRSEDFEILQVTLPARSIETTEVDDAG